MVLVGKECCRPSPTAAWQRLELRENLSVNECSQRAPYGHPRDRELLLDPAAGEWHRAVVEGGEPQSVHEPEELGDSDDIRRAGGRQLPKLHFDRFEPTCRIFSQQPFNLRRFDRFASLRESDTRGQGCPSFTGVLVPSFPRSLIPCITLDGRPCKTQSFRLRCNFSLARGLDNLQVAGPVLIETVATAEAQHRLMLVRELDLDLVARARRALWGG